MRLLLLLSAVLVNSVYAALSTTSSPPGSPTASSIQSPGLPAASATGEPPGADNWVKFIVDKDNNCRVKYNLASLGASTSEKMGRYIPASHKCLLTDQSIQPHLFTNLLKDIKLVVSYDMIFANSVLAIKGSPNFKGDNFSFFQNFPYSEQPNCPVWFSTKNPKQYWVDSRCPFNPEEWEKSQPSTTMQGWPTPIYEPHGPSTTQHLGPVETVNIKDLPRDLSKTGPPRHPTWVGLYRKNKDDKRCLIWLHDVLNNGLDLSVPIGVYNATAGRCHGFENDYRRHQAQISPGTYVTLYYQDDPRWAVTKGMFTIESRQSYQYFILGNQIGCQGFAQNQTEFEKEVYFIKKGCDSISHYANVEIWDPAKG